MTPEVVPAHVILTTRDGAAELDGWNVLFESRENPGVTLMHFLPTQRHAIRWAARLAERQSREVDL